MKISENYGTSLRFPGLARFYHNWHKKCVKIQAEFGRLGGQTAIY
jgi:hypothetical protein